MTESESEDDMNLQRCARASQSKRRTVLLVEDEPFVREATRNILESAGYEVLPAEDAADAMQIFEGSKGSVDLVMTDMILPGRTGQQLGQDLRKVFPEVKVLVTSGYTSAEYAIEEPNSQTYFLAKPYTRRGLIEKIETILGTMSLHQAAGQAS